jgi:hypothetical protein
VTATVCTAIFVRREHRSRKRSVAYFGALASNTVVFSERRKGWLRAGTRLPSPSCRLLVDHPERLARPPRLG